MNTCTDAPAKPTVLPVNFDGIPARLKGRRQWVLWRLEYLKGKWTKPPYQPNGQHADSTDSRTWSTFNDVRVAYGAGGFDGIGFAMAPDDGIVCVDLDECRDPQTGQINAWSMKLRAKFAGSMQDPVDILRTMGAGTYTEISPSATGFHIFCLGTLPPGGRKVGGKQKNGGGYPDGLEMYDQARYMTVTGHQTPGSSATVNDCNGKLTELHAAAFGVKKGTKKASAPNNGHAPPGDDAILAKAYNLNDKFARLWSGGATGYPSPSEADSAQACLLAFWTRDAEQIKQVMLRTDNKLRREKWDREDYLDRTIANALETVTEAYDWQPKPKVWEPNRKGPFPLTDTGNAERFATQHADKVRYCHPWAKWLAWDGTRWRIDDTGTIDQYAKQTARSLLKTAAGESNDKLRDALIAFSRKSEAAARRAAMIQLARSEPGIPVLPEVLDQDPWLLNCPNGTIDLRTGQLQDHRREDHITKLCPVKYVPDAPFDDWLYFLAGIVRGNSNLADFIQRLLGYCLTGNVSEQVLPIFYGTGANGKSTLVNTFMEILGTDYSMKGAPDLLMAKRVDHPTERADLFGKRFVACIETDEGRRLAEALVKDLTGGDRIRARRMREDFWEFSPSHKLVLACNHKPVVRGTDHAMWRRIRLVPFDVTIPPEEQDKALPEKLRAELPGILTWCVQGCLDWQRDGLGEPQEIVEATTNYRGEEDVLAEFFDECCVLQSGWTTSGKDLYAAFKGYCEESGERVTTRRQFGTALTGRNLERYRNNGIWYRGIGLLHGRTEG